MRRPSRRAKSNDGAKIDRGISQLVAAHAERYDAQGLQLGRPAGDFHGRIGTELAGGIEDQGGPQAAERHGLRDFADGGEIGFQILHAAEHDARGNGDFGIDDVLPQQFLAELARDERVVFRVAQKRGYPFERFEKAVEI